MMRVRISLTLDLSVLSIVIVVVHWTIIDKISALDPASDMMAPRYLKLVTV